jgi:hypothetical protein
VYPHDVAEELLDEFCTSENPLISKVMLAAPAEGFDHRPTAETPDETAALKLGTAPLCDARGDKGTVGSPGPADGRAELLDDGLGRLPGAGHGSKEGAVAGPWVPIEATEVWDHPCAQGIQVEVADKFQQVRLLLDHDGLVPVQGNPPTL